MKTFKPISAIIAFFIVAITGCNYSSTAINSEKDKAAAESVAGMLYLDIQNKDYDDPAKLFSKQFFTVTSREKLKEIFVSTNKKLGDLKDTNLTKWDTKVVKGTNPSANYQLVYNNTYKNYAAEEIITLIMEDGKIKIIGYRINSEGFFK
ncbi:MAG: hypothetical protein ABIN95_02155 [Mucilaginibacter sp.]